MITNLYLVAMLLSCALLVIFLFLKRYSYTALGLYVTLVFVNFSYYAGSVAVSASEALLANRIGHLDGTLLLALVILTMCYICQIQVKPVFRAGLIGVAVAVLIAIWIGQENGFYYTAFSIEQTAEGTIFRREYGPGHFIYISFIIFCMTSALGLGVYAARNRNKISFHHAWHMFGILLTVGCAYLIERFLQLEFTVLPFAYVIMGMLVLGIIWHSEKYSLNDIVNNSKTSQSRAAYVIFDRKKNYLGALPTPEIPLSYLSSLYIDRPVPEEDAFIKETFLDKIDTYSKEDDSTSLLYEGDRIYEIRVMDFQRGLGLRPTGYLFEIMDDTEHQKYLDLLNSYNDDLAWQIEEKARDIILIQQKVAERLAEIIEERDSNTGGHVKRTREVVAVLVRTIMENHLFQLSAKKAEMIIRSAHMHDLGKISISDTILNKPGRFTPEERAVMETHAVRSGEIVRTILKDIEDGEFVTTAYNIARHHHERWDGKGYPDGLSGEDIPVEARIMAVADVYDALVSHRVYKDAFSFEKAAEIMEEGMGSQFDEKMRKVFELSREEIEAFYSEESRCRSDG